VQLVIVLVVMLGLVAIGAAFGLPRATAAGLGIVLAGLVFGFWSGLAGRDTPQP
jgi:uncharacterized membrane protein YedE/YeeE